MGVYSGNLEAAKNLEMTFRRRRCSNSTSTKADAKAVSRERLMELRVNKIRPQTCRIADVMV
jgi:hypothetical protein